MDASIIIDNVAVREFPASYTFGPHSHRFIEVDFVETGSCGMLFGTESVRLTTNDCLLIYPDVRHFFFTKARASCTIVQLEFAVENFPQGSLGAIQAPGRSFLKLLPQPSLSQCIRNIRYEQARAAPDSAAMMRLLFDQLFLLLKREVDGVYSDPAHRNERESPLVRNLVEVLKNDYEEPLTIEGVSDGLGVSSRYLRRIFHDAYGMTIGDFLTGLRLKKASSLLGPASLSILEVALQSGFSSSQYFARVFKKEIGLTPGAFRRLRAEQGRDQLPHTVSSN